MVGVLKHEVFFSARKRTNLFAKMEKIVVIDYFEMYLDALDSHYLRRD